MSNDLHDLFKKELDQVPLRPADTWVPAWRPRSRLAGSSWRTPVAIAVAALVLIAALVGGRQLAAFRDQSAATPGIVAGKAIYLSPSFNGSGWIQIDPETLNDVSAKPLLDIAPTTASSLGTQVSADGSVIIVGDNGSLANPTRATYDARSGALRGYLVPRVAMVTDFLSADGTMAMGRLGNNNNAMTDAKAIISVADGHVIRTVPPGPIGDVQAIPVAPDLSEIYYVMVPATPNLVSATPTLQPYSLVVQSTVTGALSPPVALPGIAAATIFKSDPLGKNSPIPAVPLAVRPAIAMTTDGRQLAALSYDGLTLDLVDLRTLAVTTTKVRAKTSLLDFLRPSIAWGKTLIDQEQRGMDFTPDGSALIVAINETHYEDLAGPRRSSRGMQRIEVATGLINAETSFTEGIFGSRITPDGKSVLLIVRPPDSARPVYSLRRLDAQSLELRAERVLPDYAELQVVMARVSASPTGATPTPPTATQPSRTYCTRPTLEVLVESYFRSYNTHDVQGVLSLFNFRVPAAGGGFSSYYDDPGAPNDLRDADGVAAYLQARFALDDRFTEHTVQYPPSPYISDRGNPTATFTRTFSGLSQSGSMQFDCNGDRLVHVRLSSQ
jgi:hypothetical protein